MSMTTRQSAERSVLSTMMQRENVLYDLVDRLSVEHFTSLAHQQVFAHMAEAASSGKTCDSFTLAEMSQRDKSVADMPFLAELHDWECGDPERFVRIVEDARKRDLLRLASMRATEASSDDALDTTDILDGLQAELFDISRDTSSKDAAIQAHVAAFVVALDARIASGGVDVVGARTGIPTLDEMLSGIQAPRLYVIGGRTGIGKTAAGLRMALGMAKNGHPQGFVSCEMGVPEMLLRLVSIESGVDAKRIESGHMFDEEYARVSKACALMARLPLALFFKPGMRPSHLRSVARKLKSTIGLQVMWVDYLQQMQSDRGDPDASREQQVASISRRLKLLAGDLNIAVCAMAQVNKDADHSESKKPTLSSLRESAAIGMDADCVIFVHRDKDNEKPGTMPVPASLIIAKQRNGQTGEIDMLYFRSRTQFEEKKEEPISETFAGDWRDEG